MTDDLYPVPAEWAATGRVTTKNYVSEYARSLDDADAFWLEQAESLEWMAKPTVADQSSFHEVDFGVKWFADGVLNVSVNCIDRHLAARANQVAIVWEPDSPNDEPRNITFAELHAEVCRFANVLKARGVGKGDRVTIYLPMIPEAAFAMLACARIGVIHSIVFAGFSPDSLAGRITDCSSRIVITADEGRRGGKRVPLKLNVDAAAKLTTCLDTVIVVRATGGGVAMQDGRDIWYDVAAATVSTECAARADEL